MKFKNKQEETKKATLPGVEKTVTITGAQIKDNIENLKAQLVEAQTRVVMLQGAIQVSEQMLLPDNNKVNGVSK